MKLETIIIITITILLICLVGTLAVQTQITQFQQFCENKTGTINLTEGEFTEINCDQIHDETKVSNLSINPAIMIILIIILIIGISIYIYKK